MQLKRTQGLLCHSEWTNLWHRFVSGLTVKEPFSVFQFGSHLSCLKFCLNRHSRKWTDIHAWVLARGSPSLETYGYMPILFLFFLNSLSARV
ncbi:MAG: hypothetical protein KatS3mg019_1501 [Fimbriimonadales bacterium]|nr:MAG: hypothetical protein KatS3mg019_1501 [Fimbriimonadales bacterium]